MGEALLVGAAGEFRDDALEGLVFGVLGVEHVGEDFACLDIYHGGGGFIATGFEGEDEHDLGCTFFLKT